MSRDGRVPILFSRCKLLVAELLPRLIPTFFPSRDCSRAGVKIFRWIRSGQPRQSRLRVPPSDYTGCPNPAGLNFSNVILIHFLFNSGKFHSIRITQLKILN